MTYQEQILALLTQIELNTRPKKRMKRDVYFTPPAIEEIVDYCLSVGIKNVEPPEFIDFYESKNWMIGKNKMKNWRAAVRTWEKRNKPKRNIIKI